MNMQKERDTIQKQERVARTDRLTAAGIDCQNVTCPGIGKQNQVLSAGIWSHLEVITHWPGSVSGAVKWFMQEQKQLARFLLGAWACVSELQLACLWWNDFLHTCTSKLSHEKSFFNFFFLLEKDFSLNVTFLMILFLFLFLGFETDGSINATCQDWRELIKKHFTGLDSDECGMLCHRSFYNLLRRTRGFTPLIGEREKKKPGS